MQMQLKPLEIMQSDQKAKEASQEIPVMEVMSLRNEESLHQDKSTPCLGTTRPHLTAKNLI